MRATPVFVAAIVSEALVVALWLGHEIGFLWFNVIGCAAVVVLSFAIGGSNSAAKLDQTGNQNLEIS